MGVQLRWPSYCADAVPAGRVAGTDARLALRDVTLDCARRADSVQDHVGAKICNGAVQSARRCTIDRSDTRVSTRQCNAERAARQDEHRESHHHKGVRCAV
eukprot:6278135-Pyramimonas_sp.AAC.2